MTTSFLATFQHVASLVLTECSKRRHHGEIVSVFVWLTFLCFGSFIFGGKKKFFTVACRPLLIIASPNDHRLLSLMLLSPVNQPPPHKIDKEAPRLWHILLSLDFSLFFYFIFRRSESIGDTRWWFIALFIFAISHVACRVLLLSSHSGNFRSLNFHKQRTHDHADELQQLINNSIIEWKFTPKKAELLRVARSETINYRNREKLAIM